MIVTRSNMNEKKKEQKKASLGMCTQSKPLTLFNLTGQSFLRSPINPSITFL